mmetsp:Transcript_120605/g.219199  ORF Transcript_120605/g.219199 Transcript_120605/m.219199 type:complete len:661 (-) Transcript_120605:22-2004(-)
MRMLAYLLACSAHLGEGLRKPSSIHRIAESQQSFEAVSTIASSPSYADANVGSPLKVLASYLLAFNAAVPSKAPGPAHIHPSRLGVAGMSTSVMDRPAESTEEGDAKEEAAAEGPLSPQAFWKLHRITLKGNAAEEYEPMQNLFDTPFDSAIKDVFRQEGYKKPTPIQALSWPIALEGRDVVNIAKTGSGKTLAYLMPIFYRYMRQRAYLNEDDDVNDDDDEQGDGKDEEDAPADSEANQDVAEDTENLLSVTRAVQIPPKLIEPFQGKGGENFKKLKKKTGCVSIEIKNETLPEAADRTILIKGAAASVEAARASLSRAIGKKADSPKILVLAPTRELVTQIWEEAVKYAHIPGIRVFRMIGAGARKEQQIFLLRTIRPQMIVATPGRLTDLIEAGEVSLREVEYLVLDEADRMLDLGFENNLRQIVRKLPDRGQAMMYSATWPEKVKFLSSKLLSNPVYAYIGEKDKFNANRQIKQHVKVLPNKSAKVTELVSLLDELNPDEEKNPNSIPKTLIFVDRRNKCADLAAMLGEKGYKVHTMHSRMQQHVRTKVMNRFRRGDLRVLVTTDLASRGLDVTDVEVVINFDMPEWKVAAENYVHRIGRTARGDRDGRSFTFITKADKKAIKPLVGVLERAEQEVPEDLRAMLLKTRNPYKEALA